jgi:hypothetical protein
MAGLAVACFGSVQHALGVAKLTAGEPDGAVAHLREAVHGNLALGHWPAVVYSRMRLAEALALRGAAGDEAAAREQREQAAADGAVVKCGSRAGMFSSLLPSGPATCTRHGRGWRLGLARREVLVEDSVGMFHLAVLIANPGAEIAAIDLMAGLDAAGREARASGMPSQPMLDRTAIQSYRRRLADLGDDDGARGERDWLLAELSAHTRAGGQARPFTDNVERARLAAGKAIRRAMATIGRADGVIGTHLRDSVHTGVRCCYRPV